MKLKTLVLLGALAFASVNSQASVIPYSAGSDVCDNTSCTQTRNSYTGLSTIREGAIKNGGMDTFDIFGFWKRFDGLTLNRDVDVFTDSNTYRFVDTFTNENSVASSLTMRFLGSFGSGFFTQTESEDDTSVVVHDGGQETPVTGYTWGNNDWAADNTSFSMFRGAVTNLFDISLDPGESLTIVQFLTTSRADAEYEVESNNRHELYDSSAWAYDITSHIANVNTRLGTLSGTPDFTGLSDFQLDTILNFTDGQVGNLPVDPVDPPVSVDAPSTLGVMAMGLGLLLRRRFS